MTTPKISWVMPVYNQGGFVAAAIASILEQSFPDFELIVVDDGSDDCTSEVVGSFHDDRIRLLKNPCNMGVSSSLNEGIRASQGEYIARMDGDDLSTPDRLAKQVGFMDANPQIAVCGSYVETIGAVSRVVKRPLGSAAIKCFLLAGPPFSHPSVIIRRAILERHALYYDEGIGSAQDYELWFRVLQVAPGWNLDEVLLKHRLHDRQVSVGRVAEQEANASRVRREVLRLLGITADAEAMERHTRLFRNTLEPAAADLEWAAAWLEMIVEKNRGGRVFEEEALRVFLNGRLEQYAARCASHGVTLRYLPAAAQGLLSRVLKSLFR